MRSPDPMKAVRYHRPKKVSVDEVPEPELQEPRDAIIRVTSTAICGSDLHIYNGLVPQFTNMTFGHEFVGVVEELGEEVDNLEVGDRVLVPFPIACGTCWFCKDGLPTACENSNPMYGPDGKMLSEKGGGIFGYSHFYGGKDGGQAEKVRVPYADYGPRKIPDGLKDEQVLLLTDVVPTAWHAVKWGEVQEGDTVAVYGCGPVGLMAQRIARHVGAGRVFGIDIEEDRLEMARRKIGSVPLHADKDDAVEIIREDTDGRGADVVIDAVGMEAHRNILEKASAVVHLQRGTMKVLRDSFSAVRRGGRVSIVGVYASPYDNFPMHQFFDKALRMRGGQANVHEVVDELIGMTQREELRSDDLITHVRPLSDAPEMYEKFMNKEDGCVKVVLKP